MISLVTLTFNKRIYLMVVITILLIVILGFLNYWLMMRISSVVSQIQEKRQALAFRSRIVEGETLLKSDLVRAQREAAFLDNILPSPDNLIDFPRDINIWANQNSMDVGFSFLRESESNGTEPGFIPFILTGAGQLNNILNFIRTMEGSRYFIKFNQYDLVSEGGKFTLFINGQIFSR